MQDIAFVLMCLLVLVYFFLLRQLLDRLEVFHPELYERMDLQTLRLKEMLWDASDDRVASAGSLLRGFLSGSGARQLKDAIVLRLALRMRWVTRLFIGAFLVFLVSFFMGPRAAPPPAKDEARLVAQRLAAEREKAFQLHRAHRFTEAIPLYDALLERQPRDPELLLWRARAHEQLQQDALALQDLQQLRELEPAHLDGNLQTNSILVRQQRWDDVLALWDAFLGIEPGQAQAYLERGRAHFHKGDRAAALADVRRACALGGSDACNMVKHLQRER